jgi:DNA-binding NarL/FixJ family response regulator
MKSRLIIADDHQVVRQGLRDMVRHRSDLEIVAEAWDGAMAEDVARATMAELLILDIGLPVRRGLAVLERLRGNGFLTPVIFFSLYPAAQYAGPAKKAGAQGFVGKEASADEVLRAIDAVLAGGTSFPLRPELAGGDPFKTLSAREEQVLSGLLAGTSLQDLSETMGLSNKTLSTYRARLLAKLDVTSNAELVALAMCHGYR